MKFIPEGEQTTQREMADLIAVYLDTLGKGWAHYTRGANNLFSNLPRLIHLTAVDWEISSSRSNERKWHMAVRNAYRAANGRFFKSDGGYQLASKVKRSQPPLDMFGG
jgi:hypothetical protein